MIQQANQSVGLTWKKLQQHSNNLLGTGVMRYITTDIMCNFSGHFFNNVFLRLCNNELFFNTMHAALNAVVSFCYCLLTIVA